MSKHLLMELIKLLESSAGAKHFNSAKVLDLRVNIPISDAVRVIVPAGLNLLG